MAEPKFTRRTGRMKRSYLSAHLMHGGNKKAPNHEAVADLHRRTKTFARVVTDSFGKRFVVEPEVPNTKLNLSYWLGAVQNYGGLTKEVVGGDVRPVWDAEGKLIPETRDVAPPMITKLFKQKLKQLWEKDKWEELKDVNEVVLQKGKHTELRMQFIGTEFLFIERRFRVLRRSTVCSSNMAIVWKRNPAKIRWVTTTADIPPEDTS